MVASDYAVEMLEGAGLLQPLDHAVLPNLKNLAPRFRDVRHRLRIVNLTPCAGPLDESMAFDQRWWQRVADATLR